MTEVLADQGAAILVSVGPTNVLFQLWLLKYMLKSILIIEVDNTRHVMHLGRMGQMLPTICSF